MDFKFEVTAPAPQPALAIRTRTPVTAIGEVMGQAFGKVYQYMLEIGAKPGECAFAAYYNMDMNDLDVDIGFVLAEPAPGRGRSMLWIFLGASRCPACIRDLTIRWRPRTRL